MSQRDPFALSLPQGCPQGAPWLRQAQPERLRKICLRHVPIESASLNLKYPFGLSLSKPCAALRQAQRERFKQIRAVSIIRQKRLKSLRRRCETALSPPRDLRPQSSATASAHGHVRQGRQTRVQIPHRLEQAARHQPRIGQAQKRQTLQKGRVVRVLERFAHKAARERRFLILLRQPWRSPGRRSRCSCCSGQRRTCGRCPCRTRRTHCAGAPSGPWTGRSS